MKTIRNIEIERLSIISNKTFEEAVAALEKAVSHPNIMEFMKNLYQARTYAEMEKILQKAVGDLDFMVFMSLDQGAILQKETGLNTPKLKRYLIGNALIMKEMAKHVPNAGSYAPVTILVDERSDGVYFTYDKMVSLLAAYGNEEALVVARDLDLKVENLLIRAAT